jgi:hypothetical protein
MPESIAHVIEEKDEAYVFYLEFSQKLICVFVVFIVVIAFLFLIYRNIM